MKIAIFTEGSFIPSMDGASVHFSGLAKSLSKNGFEVCIFHCYRGWSDIKLISKENFKTYFLPPNSFYKNYPLLSRLIKSENPDIIQMNDLETILHLGAKLKKDFQKHLVFDAVFVSSILAKQLGASKPEINQLKKSENLVGKLCDAFLCLNSHDKKGIIRLFGVKDSEVHLLPCGIEIPTINFYGPNFKNKNLLFLGNMFFEPNKRAVEAIANKIMPSLINSAPNLNVLFVGDCPNNVRKRYESDKMIFLGRVPDLNSVFKKTTIALAPIVESAGIRVKILFYLAAGLPVISTSNAAMGLDDEGVIFRTNISNFGKVIQHIFDQNKTILSRVEKGKRMIEEKYNWDIIGTQAKEIYQRIKQKAIKYYIPEMNLNIMQEPFWLKETIEKGRFKKSKSRVNFLFAISNHGRVKYFYV